MIRPFKLLLTCFLLIPCLLSAQSRPGMNGKAPMERIGTLKGNVIDSLSGQPVEYANVVLFKARDSSMVTGGVTNTKGKFLLDKLPYGKYYLVTTFIGYSKHTLRQIEVTPKKPEVNLGDLHLRPTTSNLPAVDIVAEKKLVEFRLDKKVVNVEKNLSTVGGTAVDVLQNVPSVTVDYDGSVSLRGSSNVTVLVDDRPSSLTGLKLEQIPASSIESVEVITNPSAKYNPEGMSGIINIKLKKKRDPGYNGILTLNAGTGDKYNGSLNMNYNLRKINLFGSYDNRYDRRTGKGDTYRYTTLADSSSIVRENSDSRRKRNSNGIKLGMDYTLNAFNTLTFSWLNNKSLSKSNENSLTNYYSTGDVLRSLENKESVEDENETSNDYSFNYKRTFGRKEQELTADFIYTADAGTEKEDLTRSTGYPDSLSPELPLRQNTSTDYKHTLTTIQADYVHPLSKDIRLEFGYQSIFRYSDDDYIYENYDYDRQTWSNDTNLSNHFIYDEKMYGLYAIFSATLGKYSFQIGTRLEQANTKAEQRTSNETFNNNYFSVFPTVHFTRKFAHDQDVQLSYSRRINRPNMYWLNPFVDYSHPGIISYGNPGLKPEYINSYEAGYSRFWKKTMVNGSLFYKQINDVIKRYTFLDSNGLLNNTSINLASGTSYGIELITDQEIFRWWKFNLNFSYFRTVIKGTKQNTSLTNDNYSWTSRLNTTLNLSKRLTLQLTGFYRGPMVTPQGEMKEMFSSEAALRADLWKDKASLTFRVSDLFNTMKFRNTSSGEGFYANSSRKRESRVAFIGFTYKINQGIKQKGKKPNGDNNNNNFDEGEF